MLTKLLVRVAKSSLIDGVPLKSFHISATVNIKDYYEVLSIPRNSSLEEIKSAYYTKAKTHHPDKNNGGSKKFQEITEAYEVLSDSSKRRAYDTTLRASYGYRSNFTSQNYEAPPRHPQTPAQNISLKHIHHVYRTLNREEEKEEPKFRIFEEHTYPGTDFNRFEYSRKWDAESRTWTYMKRADVKDYERKAIKSMKVVKVCVSIVLFGIMFNVINYKVISKSMSNQSSKSTKDKSSDRRAGMYIIDGNER